MKKKKEEKKPPTPRGLLQPVHPFSGVLLRMAIVFPALGSTVIFALLLSQARLVISSGMCVCVCVYVCYPARLCPCFSHPAPLLLLFLVS